MFFKELKRAFLTMLNAWDTITFIHSYAKDLRTSEWQNAVLDAAFNKRAQDSARAEEVHPRGDTRRASITHRLLRIHSFMQHAINKHVGRDVLRSCNEEARDNSLLAVAHELQYTLRETQNIAAPAAPGSVLMHTQANDELTRVQLGQLPTATEARWYALDFAGGATPPQVSPDALRDEEDAEPAAEEDQQAPEPFAIQTEMLFFDIQTLEVGVTDELQEEAQGRILEETLISGVRVFHVGRRNFSTHQEAIDYAVRTLQNEGRLYRVVDQHGTEHMETRSLWTARRMLTKLRCTQQYIYWENSDSGYNRHFVVSGIPGEVPCTFTMRADAVQYAYEILERRMETSIYFRQNDIRVREAGHDHFQVERVSATPNTTPAEVLLSTSDLREAITCAQNGGSPALENVSLTLNTYTPEIWEPESVQVDGQTITRPTSKRGADYLNWMLALTRVCFVRLPLVYLQGDSWLIQYPFKEVKRVDDNSAMKHWTLACSEWLAVIHGARAVLGARVPSDMQQALEGVQVSVQDLKRSLINARDEGVYISKDNVHEDVHGRMIPGRAPPARRRMKF